MQFNWKNWSPNNRFGFRSKSDIEHTFKPKRITNSSLTKNVTWNSKRNSVIPKTLNGRGSQQNNDNLDSIRTLMWNPMDFRVHELDFNNARWKNRSLFVVKIVGFHTFLSPPFYYLFTLSFSSNHRDSNRFIRKL